MARKKQAQPEVINEELQEQEQVGHNLDSLGGNLPDDDNFKEPTCPEYLKIRDYLVSNKYPIYFVDLMAEYYRRKGDNQHYIITYNYKFKPVCFELSFKKVKITEGTDYKIVALIYTFTKKRNFINLKSIDFTYSKRKNIKLCDIEEEIKYVSRALKF